MTKGYSLPATGLSLPTETPADAAQRLFHKFRAHQVELEIQNKELRATQAALEQSRDDYAELFDFAPVGFLKLNDAGLISKINFTGSRLLGEEHGVLLDRPFANYITESDLARWHRFYAGLLQQDEARTCEFAVKRRDGSEIFLRADCRCPKTGASTVLVALFDLSAREQAAMDLRASDEFKQRVLDSVSSTIAVLDADGVIIAINEPWRRFALENGPEPGRAARHTEVGVNYLEVCGAAQSMNSEGAAEAYEGICAVQSGRLQRFDLEYACHSPDEQRWFAMSVLPLGDEGQGVVVAHNDITERKCAREQLVASEARYRSVVEDQTEVIGRVLPDGTLVFANKVYGRLMGKPVEELIGNRWHLVAHPDDLPMIEARLSEMSPGNPVVTIENRVFVANGELRWMQFVNRGFYQADGVLLEIQAVGRDITALKQAEAALQESEARLQRAQAVARIGSFSLKSNSDQFTQSRETVRLFDLDDRLEVRFSDWFSRVHPDDQAAVEAAWNAALRGAPFDMTYRIVVRGQVIWIRGIAELTIDEHGQLIECVGTVQDITEQKQLEIKLNEYRNELERSVAERTAELAAKSAQLEQALSNAELGTWSFDFLNGRAIHDERYCAMLGYTPEEFGQTYDAWNSRIHPDDLDAVEAAIKAHQAGETRMLEFEHRLRHKQGHWVWFVSRGRALFDAAQRPIHATGTIQDISHRKLVATEGAELLRKFETLIAGLDRRSPDPGTNGLGLPPPPRSKIRLSGRHREVLQLIAEGMTSAQIAKELGISEGTAASHRRNVMRNLGLKNKAEVVRYAIKHGIVAT